MGDDKVLIIEDDPEIADIVSMNIRDLGLKTDHESNGKNGLSRLIKEILDLHGGSVEVKSTPGNGSMFIINLPI